MYQTASGNTGRKGLGVWRETLEGRGRNFEGKTDRKMLGVLREALTGRVWEF